MPHGLTVDHQNNIWLTDVALHQVFKFTHDGKLLLTLGESNKAGNDSLHFNMPTDIAVCKDGSFYVSDGYGNCRIVKFLSIYLNGEQKAKESVNLIHLMALVLIKREMFMWQIGKIIEFKYLTRVVNLSSNGKTLKPINCIP